MTNQQIDQLFKNAVALYSQKQFEQAEQLCHQILKINRFFPDAYNILSAISNEKGDLDKSIEYIKNALLINPNNHLYCTNLGEFYRRQGDYKNAEISLRKAVTLKADFSGSRYNLANVLKAQGKIEEAINYYNEALSINKDDFQSLQNMGNAFLEMKNYTEAATCYWRAIRINPNLADAESSLANCFYEMKNYYKAEFHYKGVLQHKPDDDQATKSLAVMFEKQGRVEEAYNFYKIYSEKDKEDFARHFHLESLEPNLYMTNYEIDSNRKKLLNLVDDLINKNIQELPENGINENIQPNIQLGYQGRNNKELKIKYAEIFKSVFKKEKNLIKYNNDRKIRIGYFVSSSHEGIFSKFTGQIINNLSHDFEQFVICGKSGYEKYISKEITKKEINIIHIEDKFIEISNTIKELNLDILYHWEVGTDPTNYFLPLLKLAPIQCTGIGWPDTSGMSEIDYFISSEYIETADADNHYTEKLIRFKNLPLVCKKPEIKTEHIDLEIFGIYKDNNTYLCSQNLRKIHPDFDLLVRNILKKDEKGIIIFVDNESKHVTDQLKTRLKITCYDVFEQIVFLPILNYERYLGLTSQVDVILDTLYFGGATTSYEGFAMLTPIVTYPWEYEKGRYTDGCYQLMNINECTANSFEQYVLIAVKLGTDKSFNQSIREKISNNNHILFDNLDVIEEYENFFRDCLK